MVDIAVLWIFEGSFAMNIMIKFIVDYYEEGKKFPERDSKKIALHYVHNELFWDLIPTIPFNLLKFDKNRVHLTNISKVIRLKYG